LSPIISKPANLYRNPVLVLSEMDKSLPSFLEGASCPYGLIHFFLNQDSQDQEPSLADLVNPGFLSAGSPGLLFQAFV
jgi:hypothetical protein